MKAIDFYFDFRSPYSYLAHSQLGQLGREIRYCPMDVLEVMRQVGNTPTTIVCPSKGKYAGVDLQRWSKRYGVPIRFRGDMKSIDGRRLLRAAMIADEKGLIRETVEAIFPSMWAAGKPLNTIEDLARVLEDRGLDSGAILTDVDAEGRDGALTIASREAADRGVFGAPTFFVPGGEMFFGNDRLDFLREHLEAA